MQTEYRVIDKEGYVRFIDKMGTEESIIEAARMSTGKGFISWEHYKTCKRCSEPNSPSVGVCGATMAETQTGYCGNAEFNAITSDANLLEFLYSNRHMTPFEMCEIQLEVFAPIMVFREWHRHRTQSYNEFSARYAVMPNVHYIPDASRIQKQSTINKQGSGEVFSMEEALNAIEHIDDEQAAIYRNYEAMIKNGVAKEVARINTPVSRYSKMRVKTDLRNWLSFLSLRMELSAQYEIRQFANAVGSIIKDLYPRTFALWAEHDFLAVRFSATEMRALRKADVLKEVGLACTALDLSPKQRKALLEKLDTDKPAKYADVPAFRRE